MEKFKKIVVQNLFISIPTIVISLLLIGFLFIGLSTQSSKLIANQLTLSEVQRNISNELQSASTNRTFDDPFVKLNPYNISPLTALVIFETELEERIEVTVKGKDDASSITFTTDKATSHIIPVYGLYDDFNNEIVLKRIDNNQLEKILIIRTAESSYLNETVSSVQTTKEFMNQRLMVYMPPNGSPYALDLNGDLRWYLNVNVNSETKILENNHFLFGSERTNIFENIKVGFYEMDFLGKIYNEYTMLNGYSGKFLELPNNQYLVLSSDNDKINNVLAVVDKTSGRALKNIKISDYISEDFYKNELWTTIDYYKINGLALDEENDLLFISLQARDLILALDSNDYSLQFIIGDKTLQESLNVDKTLFLDPQGDNFEWFKGQSSIDITSNQELIIFDNKYSSDDTPKTSRVVKYEIDKEQKTITQLFEKGEELNDQFYSVYHTDVNVLENNYLLVNSGSNISVDDVVSNTYPTLYDGDLELIIKSRVVVFDDDNVLYNAIGSTLIASTALVDFSKNLTFKFGINSYFNTSITPSNDEVKDIDTSLFDLIPKRYNLEVYKEIDRLVIMGDFKSDEEVYISIENDSKSFGYRVLTRKNNLLSLYDETYTDKPISFYINETGVKGVYNIFITINGQKFNTYKKVYFEG
ncbi:aryl-sulfate sulfotransferase [Candidatus Izimaplasma sp. ZiA1]|uniref:aryl-sulfate sulfotransferase n=1 Tax=Candidatus Izimoplasma sp. ZiA1 TaxID=2024899 RepID=UPI001439B5A2